MKNKLPDHICPRPFMELSVQHDGAVWPCCLMDEYQIGSITENSISQLWNNERMQNLRQEFISGDIKTCSDIIKQKGCNQWYPHFREMIDLKKIQTTPIKKLDIRLTGKCNLECIMCTVRDKDSVNYTNSELWNSSSSEVLPYLYEIDLLGGEPFVQRETFKFIDEVSAVNSQCRWNITTNGNWNFGKKIRSYLDKIKVHSITLSLDSIFPATFFKIRKKSSFKRVLSTFHSLNDYCRKRSIEFKIDCVVQLENYDEIFSYIKFAIKKEVDYSFIFLTNPTKHSVLNLKDDKKIIFLHKLKEEYLRTSDCNLLTIYNPLVLSLDEKQKNELGLNVLKC